MISVCMATYNGELYIEKQLESILVQSVGADEVIICDDGSQDRTVERIRAFLSAHHLTDTWQLYCNEENKGYPANFYYAMGLCSGDIVFLADQDDIWAPDKLKVMSRILQERQDVKVVCCKFGLVDAEGKEIHSAMNPSQSLRKKSFRTVSAADVFYKCEWPGMVMAYRKEWFSEKLRSWQKKQPEELHRLYPEKIPHDFLLSAWAAEEDGFLQIDAELAWHRRHDRNAGAEEHHILRLLNKERKLWEIEKYNGILDAFEREKVLETEKGQELLACKRRSMGQRYEALASGKVIKVLKSAWNNRRMVRIPTVVCDMAIVLGERCGIRK